MLVQILLMAVLHGRNHYFPFIEEEIEASVSTRINIIIVAAFQLFPFLIGLLSPTTDVFLPIVMEK